VRGISGTCRITAGTWREVVLARIISLMRFDSASSSVTPSASRTKSTTRTSFCQSCPITIDSTTSSNFSTCR
jgi:hypothetical protein